MGRLLAIALALMASCDKRAPAPPPPPGPSIELIVDGKIRSLVVDRAVPLSEAIGVPAASWFVVIAETSDERWLELPTPSTTYAGNEIRIYLDHERVALGVFPPVTADMPPEVAAIARQPIASLVGVASLQIHTSAPRLPPLSMRVSGKEVVFDLQRLRGVPKAHGDAKRALGWSLHDVIALGAVAPTKQVVVVGATSLTLPAAELADSTKAMLLKLTKRGSYVFRVWETDAKTPSSEVRDVTRIDVD